MDKEWVQCICGEDICKIQIPPALAGFCGADYIWTHRNREVMCYPNNPDALAEPYESMEHSWEQDAKN